MKLNNILLVIFVSFIYPAIIVGTVEDEDGNELIESIEFKYD